MAGKTGARGAMVWFTVLTNSDSNAKRRAASVGCGVVLYDGDGLWVMGDRGRDRLTVRSANDSAGP